MTGARVPHVPGALVARVAEIVEFLGSDHDGERSAAAYLVTMILRKEGLTWRQVIEAAGPRTTGAEPDELPGWVDQIQTIIQHLQYLTDWESEFALSIMGHGRKWIPSTKQLAVIERIFRKVRSA